MMAKHKNNPPKGKGVNKGFKESQIPHIQPGTVKVCGHKGIIGKCVLRKNHKGPHSPPDDPSY